MTLRELRDRLSVLHCAVACGAVALGGGVQWWSLTITAVCTVWAFVRPLPTEPSSASQRLWTGGILVALIATLARALLRAEFLDAGVDFLLLLIVQRLFNRQHAREHSQLLLLSTLLMVVGAVVNTGLNYPILFAGYLLVATMALIVNHLLSEGERLGARVQADVARAGIRSRRNLWRAAAGVASVAAVGGLLVFLVFPRWGAGVFLRGNMARSSQSGFSGVVQLGGFGRIKTDATVVARLRPLQPMAPQPRVHWHLRGSSLNVYEHGRWAHSSEAHRTPLQRLGPFEALAPNGRRQLRITGVGVGRLRSYGPEPIEGFARSEEMLEVQVILEDIGVDVLFAASEPLAIRTRPRGSLERQTSLRGGYNLEIRVAKPPGPIQYEFVSRIGEPTPEELAAVGNPSDRASMEPYLELEGLSDEVTELAERLTVDSQTRYDKVTAVMEHLSGFGYTTELTEPTRVQQGADPIEGFLFDTQSGHCEYFATAMAVLLREVDVPTRIVNGYYGAQYNDLGDFYAVRQADAHSWVEVYFGGLGWVTFDPTPPSGRAAGNDVGLFPAVNQAVDAMRNAYLEYVIDYNLTKQLALLQEMGVRKPGGHFGSQVDWKGLLSWAGGFVFVGALGWWLWRRRRRPVESPEVQLYGRLLARFAARGYDRLPNESPTRFADRLQGQSVAGAAPFSRFAKLYEEIRFGASPTSSDRAALARAADEVGASMHSR